MYVITDNNVVLANADTDIIPLKNTKLLSEALHLRRASISGLSY